MAKVNHNVVVEGLSGAVGQQLVFKRGKAGRTIVAYKPRFNENRVFTAPQLAQQLAFRQAAAYAHTAQVNPLYITKAKGTPHSAYNLAIADWFTPPDIMDLDLSGYTGQAGQVIRVKALDDVQVKSLSIVIADDAGSVIEQGPATTLDSLAWVYTTTAVAAGAHPRVQATAQDLPGHTGKLEKMK